MMIPKVISLLTVLTVMSSLAGCRNSTLPSSASGVYFDTIVNIDIYGATQNDRERILDECMKMCARYQALFDKNTDTSDIARINHSDGTPVSVDKDTVSLILNADKYSVISNGRFDITIEPVSSLWDFHDDKGVIPDEKELEEAVSKVNHNNISVNEDDLTVTAKDGAKLDPGGVAKGYIADRIAEYVSGCDITGAVINIGGDIQVVGAKPDESLFNIGITDPGKNGVAAALTLSDTAVATSGTYERCFTANGKEYHHILDVQTGYPVSTDITSVTVVTKSAADADCLCTICILEGFRDAYELIEGTDDAEAVFILSDGSIKVTPGLDGKIRY